jgi:hypothetical protein
MGKLEAATAVQKYRLEGPLNIAWMLGTGHSQVIKSAA